LTNADPNFSLHGGILLKAIRTTYNIFLLSKSNDVQIVAQGTCLQMVQNVFSRIPNPKDPRSKQMAVKVPSPTAAPEGQPVKTESDQSLDQNSISREFKDAFKVFKTLCVLSVKQLPTPEG
jgi:brefeldin A-inhibited guanine nucleotide-exchange protein